MRITKIICDYCGEEIPTFKKKDLFGIEREFYRLGKLDFGESFNNIDPHKILGIDLCEKCAKSISMKVLDKRMELIGNIIIESKHKKENRKRGI